MSKTGYTVGRPKVGEIRPLTIGGLQSAQKREKMKKQMGIKQYKMKMAIYSQLWRLANLERSKEISRAACTRYRVRNRADTIFVIS